MTRRPTLPVAVAVGKGCLAVVEDCGQSEMVVLTQAVELGYGTVELVRVSWSVA